MLTQDEYRRHRVRLVDVTTAVALVIVHFGLLMSTMGMGFTRDEGYYFHAGESYQGWFENWEENRAENLGDESFTQANIDRHWSYNPEHPVLMKSLFGLSWQAFAVDRDWVSPSTGMRLPAAAFSALLSMLLFLFMIEAFGSRMAAFFAVAALIFMPRYFFHSHLACFDSPISTAWFLVMYGYWKSLNSRAWGWATGVFFGIALITKLNAFFIPFVLLTHWVIAGRREFAFKKLEGKRRLRLPSIPLAFVTMVLLGPIIFYLGWPRHWFDTFNRITWYIGRHVNHEHYFVQYFGEALIRPPFTAAFPFVMMLITVPVITLLSGLLGGTSVAGEAVSNWRKYRRGDDSALFDRRATGVLIFLNMLIPILVISRPETPVFGGTKHWMHAMPWLCAFSGVGVLWAFKLVWSRPSSTTGKVAHSFAAFAFSALLVLPMANATLSMKHDGTAYYNQLIGGVRGAADAHLMRQFWGYSTRHGLEYLNEIAEPNTRFFGHNANGDALWWYRNDGLIREGLRDWGDPYFSDYAFFNHQRAFIPVVRDIWGAFETSAPMRVWTVNGVPVLSLYADEDRRPGPDD